MGLRIAWGVYSMRGRGTANPLDAAAGNFVRASVLAVASSAVSAILLWTPLTATNAATVQFSVPVVAAIGALVLVGEPITWRWLLPPW